ncbi:UNVERIFIED_CONTAM: Helicase-like transcription factor CHR28 [Sesamum radiatum]|uniref:Helicase-like transcription factor CHR28 n=1 Tax=Sesamum radiatum TaxID=300843 RepID=A0AAW2K1M7_SESRA
MLMVEADEGSPVIIDQIFTEEEEYKDVLIDVEAFWRVVGPPPGSAQLGSRVEDIPFVDGLKDSSNIQGDRTFGDASHAESSCCEFTGFKMSDLSGEYIDPYLFSSDDGLYFPYSSAVKSFGYDDGIMGEEKILQHPFEDLVRNKAGQSKPKCEISGANCEFTGFNMPDLSRGYIDPYLFNSDDGLHFPNGSAFKSFGYDDGITGEENYPTTPFEDLVRNKAGQSKPKCEISGASPIESGIGNTEYSCMPAVGNNFKKPSTTLSIDHSEIQGRIQGKKNIPSITSNDIISRASEVVNDVTGKKYYDAPCELSATEGIRWPSSTSLTLIPCKNNGPCAKDEKEETVFKSRSTFRSVSIAGETPVENSAVVTHEPGPVLQFPGQPVKLSLPPVKAENDSLKMENEVPEKKSFPSRTTYQGVQNNITRQSNVDCDSDVCILEDMSAPACPSRIAMNTKSIVASQPFTSRDTGNQMVAAHSRHKSNDERVIFRVALQDLSQPKSEATPPDGVLSVPLLKHQRIALSWMVNKETRSACCSGGILADDQGLGKTISTIALILKERSPPSKTPKTNERQSETETLNLDEDDDGALETYHQEAEPCQVNGSPTNVARHLCKLRAGLLLAPLLKRKLLETISDKKSSESKKTRKGINNELLEKLSGPLAKVGWFRVVLDEAQSIKNHRTQVARACWGLRAKRRWCLSGTPIQNAIDDLYSYFRFLRHEPYAVFRTFCEQLKVPIHRSPKNGYKKLQAVLKTIMLRRTKGTLIDGEPIINLPPKTIELKKVDFSKEERDFYCRLEAESRAQFAEYAAAGTVKQNYVNILLMLLRLRQACDHPLLVKGFSSNSKMTSSIEMAKKLSREKQISLLNCLEASLAICGICSDPPEDAVVTVCGHVFCNQCICEHIIGDDTQCPTKKCKTSLTMSCVFSTSTLRIALSDKLNVANTANSEVAEVSESRLLRCPEDSSKIKAALDLLLSLSKPQDCAPRTNGSELIHGVCSEKLRVCDSGQDRTLDMTRDSNNLVKYRRLDGTMPVAARDRAVKDFNSLPQVSVMIMSLKAASLGLNMVAACNVILLDLWWNPTTEDQAIDRAHRIGQKRPVSVFRLTVKDTVEDRILLLQQRKRKMVSSAFGEDETASAIFLHGNSGADTFGYQKLTNFST